MDRPILLGGALTALLTLLAPSAAQVTLVEPGHTLTLHMDSMAPLNPTQTLPEMVQPIGDIESICVDRQTGDVFFQLIFPPGAPVSQTTHVLRLSPGAGGIVTPVALNTGFGINERGTDLQLDVARNLLVTQDQNFGPPERIASVQPATGAIGTWSLVTTPPVFLSGTFGMDFSAGAGGSVVPPGDILFTSDVGASGIYSCTFAGPGSPAHVPGPLLPGAGDDVVIQPNGTWVWIGDNGAPVTAFLPVPPHAATPTALILPALFNAAGLPFTAGTRAAVCDVTGVIYVTCSAATGGTGIFRIDQTLRRAALILTVGVQGNQGIHDLEVGPASRPGTGNSVYFTVHDYVTGGEQIWEVSATACCPVPARTTIVADPGRLDAPVSIAPFPAAATPQLGASFGVHLDDPGNVCTITPGSPTFLLLNFWPGTLIVAGLGCGPGTPGDLMLPFPIVVASGPVPWVGPGPGAVHALTIPFDSSLCGLPVHTQGLWLDPAGPSAPAVLSWRLDLLLGS